MVKALLYLRLTSLVNVVRTHVLRLRQPRYLIGALFAIAYFYLLVFRQTERSATAAGGGAMFGQFTPETIPLVLGFAALALLLLVAGMWVLPNDRPGFNFSEAEIAFLFPAPVTRRALMHFKLVSTLFTSLLQTLFFAPIFNGRAVFTGRGGYILVSWWLVLSFISLHYLGSSLTIARLAELGLHARWRRLGVLALAVAVIGGVATWIGLSLPSVVLAPSVPDWLRTAFASGALRWLLWPLQLVLRPFVAANLLEFALALVPALAVLALHYVWVIRSNVAFEEAAIAGAERRAARLAELRRSGGVRMSPAVARARRAPFDLRRVPGAEAAFLWKNLLSTRPWVTARTWLVIALLLIGASLVLQHRMGHEYWKAGGGIVVLGMFTIFAALFYGPLLLRLDLRQDLPNADILKVYPLAGWRIVLGELLAPIAVLSAALWLGVLAWYLGLHGHHPPALSTVWFSPGMRLVWCACAAVAAPLVVGIELLIPNAAPVLLPGWFQTLRAPGGGIDLMGQRLIFGLAQILVIAAALAVALGCAAGVHLMLRGAYTVNALLHHATTAGPGPGIAVALATAVTMLVLAAEFAAGVWWVGRRFENLDISEMHG